MRSRNYSLLALALILAPHAFSQELPREEFAIRDSVPPTGSNIRRDIAWSSAVPINRSYAQLTAAQRRVLHSQYERIEPGDEPPFPVDGLKPLILAIQTGQSHYVARGNLTLVADVDASGTVTNVEAHAALDPDFTKLAASILMLTRFKPALCKGVPCKMQFPFALTLEVVQ